VTARDRTALGLLAVVAAIVGAWFLFVAPKRNEANRLGAQISAQQSQLRVEQGIITAGEAARRQFATYSAELAQLDTAVPADDAVPSLIVQLQRAARLSGVDFRSLALQSTGAASPTNPPASGGITKPATAPPGTAAAANAAATEASAAAAAAGTLPPGVTIGPAGLPQEPFTFTFTGSFLHLADFLGRLQSFVVARNASVAVNGRLMTLNSISLTAGPSGFPQISATINATTYLVPSSVDANAAPAPAASAVPTAGAAGAPATPAPTATVTP
jgi:Tfp pilus assembly protein PilO